MTQIVFRGPQGVCQAAAAPGTLLLDLARIEAQPIYWHCGRGTCGTCVVRIGPLRRATPQWIEIPRKERNVLAHTGHWTAEAARHPAHPDVPALPRLSCQYEIGAEDLEVSW